ncbi:uncharacterized protein BT62DRAFT_997383 [Guyanagaster necrorhizus]|uniref:C2H2-type domain-containing protein n=1 Tax=Guyanagaster necrorhizus TaxID=856835 RepID=A0A9P7VI69_9AGAR|nr:uncharacterized protein BT62DRAFT_997383 [Guyanagaster necrorhizus MCA 3950]KAG7441010.1 hypothetical protein BT62DRAFT_997383 [Guyanagaster necrorhizus MCA 3950]
MNTTVSLPSIHEMFPEHLLRVPPEARLKGSAPPRLISSHDTRYSFDLLRSDPASASLTHIASSASLPYEPQPFPPPRRESTPISSEDDGDGDDTAKEGKKHVCPTCHKRFNRPSSLRIHINTHTGATPFRCPFPGCGREFNVNSNMRRHYRNHTNPGAASLFPAPSSQLASSSSSSSSSSSASSHPSQKRRISKSEYVWRHPPSSSSTSSDDEEDEHQSRYRPREEYPYETIRARSRVRTDSTAEVA